MEHIQPGGRQPAPSTLRLVQDFVNTLDVESGRDTLTTVEALQGWLADHGLAQSVERVTAAKLRRAVEMREALRATLRGNNGGPEDGEAVETLNDLGGRAGLGVRFHGDHADVEPSMLGVDGAMGWILAVAFVSMIDGEWYRLKACRKCQWVFYDYSKNRSGTWCSMAVCGNRTKAGTFRRKQTAQSVRG